MSTLQREVGLIGAMMMGLGSILGTGVFVSVNIATEVTGPAVVLAIAVAALVATLNGLSSAQLAANHPVSGGTYEYGYRWLTPTLGFVAGFLFLCAKSASAATAALGFTGYSLSFLGIERPDWVVPISVITVVLVTLLVLSGIKRSNAMNIIIVSITLISLACFVLLGLSASLSNAGENLVPFFQPETGDTPVASFLEACALMFVAFTGYGRIATLGEEVHEPRRTIPRAIIVTLIVSSVVYMLVGFVSVAAVSSTDLMDSSYSQSAPLEQIARSLEFSPLAQRLIAVGAVTAMLGVLLNLVLGLSRVAFAMGRRSDIPIYLGKVTEKNSNPTNAILLVGGVILLLTLIGNVKTTWSFSAFTVLIYYAITNLAAIRLSEAERLYPHWIPWAGLILCLSLAFWVETRIWITGTGIVLLGLVYRFVRHQLLNSGKSD
ncbi:putative amino acid permease YhdG [Polystyrenella longa]|uniref:Putative amino acid permease YhdG n=1 Tax=Polystyrenella longa TaxID=2528007 RepID=A0A518CHB4_9PLAN|nr:APC family permease [Polystyrenella longa]QDU78610.1 putative amino acid permease YhdG [Polystyrenella longa]